MLLYMTDSSSMLQNQTAVTSDCLFNLKPSASRCRSYRASLPPINGSTFSPSTQIIFMIPGGRRNTYLDNTQTYLKLTVQNNDATNAFNLDRCGSCFINRLDVFGNDGSILLETIQQYNVLYNYMLDFQMNVGSSTGLSAMLGTSPVINVAPRNGTSVAASGRITICLPILSGVVGTLADKCLPLGKLASDIRLEFTLDSVVNSVVYAAQAGTTGWSIISAEIEAQIIELSDEAQSMVNSTISPESPIYLHGSSFRHYVGSLTGVGQFSCLISARFASLKTLIVLPRRSQELNSQISYTLSSRINPMSSYWFRIGSSIVPQKMVDLYNTNTNGGYAQAFAEVMKSWHSLNHCEYGTTITSTIYNTADTPIAVENITSAGGGYIGIATSVGTDQYSGLGTKLTAAQVAAAGYLNGFAIAQELESFAQRSDVIISGLNTNSSTIFFEGNVTTAFQGTNMSYTLDIYGCYDHILVIEPNGLINIKY